jgi:hypothetical protein
MGEMEHPYKLEVTNPEGNGPRARLRSRWEDDIKMDLK